MFILMAENTLLALSLYLSPQQEDMGEHVVPGDAHPGTVGTACLLSSFFVESGKDTGVVTLPIMTRNSRQTLGKVRGEPPHPSWNKWSCNILFFKKLLSYLTPM